MSESATMQPKPKLAGGGDRHILAQVEKWLAMIREISREQTKNQ